MNQPNSTRRTGFHATWIACAVIAAAVIAYGVSRNTQPSAATATTTSNPIPDRPSAQSQPSPQGPTGPIETKSGGAPAASPQGDAPAGMQPQNR